MSKWTADITNDPNNDYNLMVEILHNGEDIAVIHKGEEGMELKWYAHKDDLIIPLEWILNLLLEIKNKF